MTGEQIEQFRNDYFKKTGRTFAVDFGSSPEQEVAFINRVEWLIDSVISSHSPNYVMNKSKNAISEYQKNVIWEAILEQVVYMMLVGDTTLMSGIDPVTNTVIPIEEIKKRYISPIVLGNLKNSGLFYSGIGNGSRRL